MTVNPIDHARRWKTLGVLALSLVIIGLDTTILNVALPTLQDEFDASASKLQWMVDSYLLVFAGLLLVFGTLGDRFGRKRALQAGVTVFGLASLAAVLVDSADGVIGVRAAMGVGAALIMPATLSIIANLFTGEERGKAIAIWAALAAVGIGLGPLAGGLLLEWFEWWSIFLVNVPFAAVALLLSIRYVPESRDPRPGSSAHFHPVVWLRRARCLRVALPPRRLRSGERSAHARDRGGDRARAVPGGVRLSLHDLGRRRRGRRTSRGRGRLPRFQLLARW
jgi:MFS family permease